MPPLAITQAQLDQIEQSLLGRINLRPRSITEDKLAVGAVSAAIVREGSISDVHIGQLTVDTLSGGTISGETIVLADGGTIRSANYVADTSGWAIYADGSAEFNSVDIRGNLVAGTINIGGQFTVDASGNVVANNIVAQGQITALAGSNLPGDYITNGDLGAQLDLTTDGSISANYEPGESGWAIDGLGNAEFNNAILRGALYTGTAGRYVTIGADGANQITFESGESTEITPGSILSETFTDGPHDYDRLTIRPAKFGNYDLLDTQITLTGQGTDGETIPTFQPGSINIEANRLEANIEEYFFYAGDTTGLGFAYAPSIVAGFRVWTEADIALNMARRDGGAAVGSYASYSDSDGTRLGYVGYAGNDDLRLWCEATAGAVLFGTQGTSRGSIAADGSWTFGSSSAPQAVTHAFYNEEDGVPCVVVLNRQGSFTGSPRGIDVYLGASGAVNNPQNDDDFIRFRRGDGAVVGQIDGDGSGGTRYATTSDQALKKDVSKDLTEGAAAFDRIPWRSFTWKATGVRGHGVIAQQLARIPEWAHVVNRGGTFTEPDAETGRKRRYRKHWGVDYVPLIGAIGAKLADVDRRLRALEDR